jgi:hypothetical protein
MTADPTTTRHRVSGRSPLLRWAGGLFTVAALAWYGHALATRMETFRTIALDSKTVLAILLAIGLYPLLYTVGAAIWVCTLRALGTALPLRPAIRICFVSQFGKYIPGNVGHLVAKFILAEKYGSSRGHVLVSMLLETVCLIICGGLIAILTLAWSTTLRSAMHGYLPTSLSLSATVILTTVIASGFMIAGFFASRKRLLNLGKICRPAWLIPCFALYLLIFLLHGIVATTLLHAVFNITDASLLTVTGMFAVAWTAGFITPGAPAGIGVREAVLSLAMDPFCGPGVAVALAALLRLASTLGDGLTFAIGGLISRRNTVVERQTSAARASAN